MKFQSYGTAWKQVIKNVLPSSQILPIETKLPPKEIKVKEVKETQMIKQEPVLELKNYQEEIPIEKSEINYIDTKNEVLLFNKPIKDVIILGLLIIIFLLLLWNFSYMNEIQKNSYKQEKFLHLLLEHVLNK